MFLELKTGCWQIKSFATGGCDTYGWVSCCISQFTFSLNSQTIGLALGALVLTLTYPFFKRFFLFPQAILGIAFGFGILMAFSEIKGVIEPVGWALFIANFFGQLLMTRFMRLAMLKMIKG